MDVDSYLQVCFYEGASLESSEEPKLYWEQILDVFTDVQEISVGSSPGRWIS